MNRILKYNILFGAFALLAVSCNDEGAQLPSATEDSDAYIRIVSGQVGYSTRGLTDEPTFAGQCNADKLIVYQYEYHVAGTSATVKADPSKMEYGMIYETDVVHFSDPANNPYYQSDKWARQTASIDVRGARMNAFAFPALAFSKADENDFNVNYQGTLDKMSLNLVKRVSESVETETPEIYNTPEIYFGRVGIDDSDLPMDDATGIHIGYRTSISNDTKTRTMSGRLYRVVSQINVNISNVSPEIVERMTMELSNLPTEIGLYADHRSKLGEKGTDQGFHYPIVAAKANQQTENTVVVCETSNFRNGIAKLSTFLLPSDEGRSLNIHIYFKEPIIEYQEDGTSIEFTHKSYEVRPPKSFYIPSEIADAYFSSEPLCVYNVTDNLFYSYSNVRVNINGDFDNFFPDRVDVDMDIEICSRYDNEHNYDGGLIDYN